MSSSTAFTGKWMMATIGNIQYKDLYSNTSMPTNGRGLGYEFNPNGTYTYYTVLQSVMYSSQMTIYQYETGTYSESNDVLTLTPASRKVTSISPSYPQWNYTSIEHSPPRYVSWEVNPTSNYSDIGLTLVDLIPQPDGTLAPNSDSRTTLYYEGLPDVLPTPSDPDPLPPDPVIPTPINPGGTDAADRLVGTSGKDSLLGMGGDDTLLGNGGHDMLKGDEGNDVIKGGSGNDKIWGGAGSDRLWGSKGKDTFALESGSGYDDIEDFRQGQDKLGITAGINPKKIAVSQFGNDVLIWNGSDILAEVTNAKVAQFTVSDFVRLSAG